MLHLYPKVERGESARPGDVVKPQLLGDYFQPGPCLAELKINLSPVAVDRGERRGINNRMASPAAAMRATVINANTAMSVLRIGPPPAKPSLLARVPDNVFSERACDRFGLRSGDTARAVPFSQRRVTLAPLDTPHKLGYN